MPATALFIVSYSMFEYILVEEVAYNIRQDVNDGHAKIVLTLFSIILFIIGISMFLFMLYGIVFLDFHKSWFTVLVPSIVSVLCSIGNFEHDIFNKN